MKQDRWIRIDEEHRERGYSIEDIRQCLQKTGFQELACWGDFREMTVPRQDSGRVWFITRKPPGERA
jgi:DNA-binding transcriptional MerR regulator